MISHNKSYLLNILLNTYITQHYHYQFFLIILPFSWSKLLLLYYGLLVYSAINNASQTKHYAYK